LASERDLSSGGVNKYLQFTPDDPDEFADFCKTIMKSWDNPSAQPTTTRDDGHGGG
jgi:hypothetical protein